MSHSTGRSLSNAVLLAVFCLILLCRSTTGTQYRDRSTLPAHSNFVKSQYSRNVKFQIGICGQHPSICNDTVKSGGSITCCFGIYCKDLSTDRNNCGRCGNFCGFGLTCCNGSCINLFRNKHHCGNCETACFGNAECEFGLCGYGRYDSVRPNSFSPKHW
ncbi:hypothetical protein O6H91_17G032500 [Diphasiastrum complanatum]|uniref:Uncharacterized protein n=1 Tax=Diphasiastrum complanatum TaxID=34168 RepID=A0ACC2B5G5_DIPCM|nr:hypothetical protein O6H91_17G032500 [Diphasiastrum complanatum]